ncbi:MAG: hypothetical protein CVU44_13630 [Chloroflexi bacterium HGW-Chloroflexi-6]|nr:MAG: hypothetical protein CVU44_13630 [Chloroflexi bacterium HGW-Chloroflexi-6]
MIWRLAGGIAIGVTLGPGEGVGQGVIVGRRVWVATGVMVGNGVRLGFPAGATSAAFGSGSLQAAALRTPLKYKSATRPRMATKLKTQIPAAIPPRFFLIGRGSPAAAG